MFKICSTFNKGLIYPAYHIKNYTISRQHRVAQTRKLNLATVLKAIEGCKQIAGEDKAILLQLESRLKDEDRVVQAFLTEMRTEFTSTQRMQKVFQNIRKEYAMLASKLQACADFVKARTDEINNASLKRKSCSDCSRHW
jgi:hypothetical protein